MNRYSFVRIALVLRCVLLASTPAFADDTRLHDRADFAGTKAGRFVVDDILLAQQQGTPNACKDPAKELPEYRKVAKVLGIEADHALRLLTADEDLSAVDHKKGSVVTKLMASTREQAALEILAKVSADDWQGAVDELTKKIADLRRQIAQTPQNTVWPQQVEALEYLAAMARKIDPIANKTPDPNSKATPDTVRLTPRFLALVPAPAQQKKSFFGTATP